MDLRILNATEVALKLAHHPALDCHGLISSDYREVFAPCIDVPELLRVFNLGLGS